MFARDTDCKQERVMKQIVLIVSAIHVAICIGRTTNILWTDTTQGTRCWRHPLCRYKDSPLSRFFGISPRARHGCPRLRFPKERFLRICLFSWLERSEKYRCHGGVTPIIWTVTGAKVRAPVWGIFCFQSLLLSKMA